MRTCLQVEQRGWAAEVVARVARKRVNRVGHKPLRRVKQPLYLAELRPAPQVRHEPCDEGFKCGVVQLMQEGWQRRCWPTRGLLLRRRVQPASGKQPPLNPFTLFLKGLRFWVPRSATRRHGQLSCSRSLHARASERCATARRLR